MSDDDRDIDIESDAENDSDNRTHARNNLGGSGYYSQAEKRAHHNALERKRRDHIKDSFTSLRDSVPALQGEKVASRAQILKKAAEYIQFMRRKNNSHQQDIEDLKRQNNLLEQQIRALEKARATGNFMDAHELGLGIKSEGSSQDTDSSDGEGTTRRVKKLKINGVNGGFIQGRDPSSLQPLIDLLQSPLNTFRSQSRQGVLKRKDSPGSDCFGIRWLWHVPSQHFIRPSKSSIG